MHSSPEAKSACAPSGADDKLQVTSPPDESCYSATRLEITSGLLTNSILKLLALTFTHSSRFLFITLNIRQMKTVVSCSLLWSESVADLFIETPNSKRVEGERTEMCGFIHVKRNLSFC